MRCTDCGQPMFVTHETERATCYTCYVCPAHFYGIDYLSEGYALVIPPAGGLCPGCLILIPYEPEELRAAFKYELR